MNRTRLITVALFLAMLGCATVAPQGRAPAEPGQGFNDHMIQVTVHNDSNGNPVIFVDVEELRVKGKDHWIFWRIDNQTKQQYRFAANGIEFKSPAGKQEFTCEARGSMYVCYDPNSKPGRFAYTVTLEGSPNVKPLDPAIINDY